MVDNSAGCEVSPHDGGSLLQPPQIFHGGLGESKINFVNGVVVHNCWGLDVLLQSLLLWLIKEGSILYLLRLRWLVVRVETSWASVLRNPHDSWCWQAFSEKVCDSRGPNRMIGVLRAEVAFLLLPLHSGGQSMVPYWFSRVPYIIIGWEPLLHLLEQSGFTVCWAALIQGAWRPQPAAHGLCAHLRLRQVRTHCLDDSFHNMMFSSFCTWCLDQSQPRNLRRRAGFASPAHGSRSAS